jgi:UDP-glucose 4-epimerase
MAVTVLRVAVVGGAGFIGGHAVAALLARPATTAVTVYDNFSSGRRWHLAAVAGDPRLTVVTGDVRDRAALRAAVAGHDTVLHLASNPDIAAAATDPAIDFDRGTALTHEVAEAARLGGVELVLYASGSGVYGDRGDRAVEEDDGPLAPVSTYGASKVAGEALLSGYAAMFGIRARCFRFGNVVGPRQTHGVGYDFVRRLLTDPTRLRILGDGRQCKSYVHVDDAVAAVLTAAELAAGPFAVFNVATEDWLTVTEIAELAVAAVELPAGSTTFEYAGGARGWPGDVPVVRLDSARIRALGWKNERSCREAVRDALAALVVDARAGRFAP